MKHLIIVKWKDGILKDAGMIDEIKQLFEGVTEIEGIHDVQIHKNVTDRSNRYDLMISIEMEKEALTLFDDSQIHHEWKDKY